MTEHTTGDGVDSWRANTTAFDRVQSVALSVSEPRPAGWIAEESLVAENTAREHLERLVDMRILQAHPTTAGTTYYPDPVYVRTREIRALVESHDRGELLDIAEELREDIEGWKTASEAEDPDDLRATAVRADGSASAVQDPQRVASDWEHARYRLSLIEDALGRYSEFTTGRQASA